MFLPLSKWVVKLANDYICCIEILCFNQDYLIFSFIASIYFGLYS